MLNKRVVELYREGKNFSQVGQALKIDRHKVPRILREAGEPIRLPFQGTREEWAKLYEKTPKGFLMRTYRNMQSRVTGVQRKKAHLYLGLPILSRQDFYAWARSSHEFWRLYQQWVKSGYDRRLSPSINRINTDEGYIVSNMEWLTHSVNSSLGGSSHKRKSNKVSTLMEVYQHAAN